MTREERILQYVAKQIRMNKPINWEKFCDSCFRNCKYCNMEEIQRKVSLYLAKLA
jgi:biotin synthase-like enzyme